MKIAITGGHHSSALPLIDLINEETPSAKIIWFGHKHTSVGDKNPTLEYIQIVERGITFIDLPAGKFYKTYNLSRLAKIPLGFLFSLYYLTRHKPDVIFSFGGYLAVPVVITGWLLVIPSITHEQTLVTGYANKLISRFAKKVLISHEESADYFPKSKAVFSGLPLRRELFEIKSNNFIFETDLPIIYITCGKTGSHKINSIISLCLGELLGKYNVIHQCGDHSEFRDYEVLSQVYVDLLNSEVPPKGKYYPRKFVGNDEIGEVFSKADVLISRAGAHTVSEIKAFNKPSVLIPIPWVSHNEQYLNARAIEKLGLGIILSERDLSCKNLLESLGKALNIKSTTNNTVPIYSKEPVEIMYREMLNILK